MNPDAPVASRSITGNSSSGGALQRSESGFTSSVWYEREADLFGVELLIPEFLFHGHRKEFPVGLDGMKGLAEVFGTSLTATAIRYAGLCTELVAVVVSKGGVVLYSIVSRPFASKLDATRRTSRLRDLPAGTVTRHLNAGGKVEATPVKSRRGRCHALQQGKGLSSG